MEIKTVKLNQLEELTSFQVTLKDGTELSVPNEPLNRHYHDVSEWYSKQKKKPFKFNFED